MTRPSQTPLVGPDPPRVGASVLGPDAHAAYDVRAMLPRGRAPLAFFATWAAWAALAASSCQREPGAGGPRPPDVVLISIDSLRADHVGCYGYARDTSPTLDALAAEGVRFENAVSTTSWTLPSHAAMFTGLYDSTHGLVDNGLRLAESHATLAERLKAAGYHTAGFFGGPYLHPTFGLAQGFDVYENCMTTVPDTLTDEELRAESRAHEGRSHADVTGPRTLERVRAWSADLDEDPVFLFVHLWDVHYDFLPPAEYVERFDPDYAGDLTGVDFLGNPRIAPGMPRRDYEHLLALYDAEIRFTDDMIAGIFDALRAAGRFDDALVIVTADHGEEFLEHGAKGHQKTLFEEVVRVPLIVRAPGSATASVRSEQVRLIDLLPTVLDVAGISVGGDVQGRSLAPLLRGEALPEEPALLELLADGRAFRALRTNAGKVISYAPGDARRYYDLRTDPRERLSLERGDPVLEESLEELKAHTVDALRVRQELRRGVDALAPDAPDLDGLLQQLHGLGYIDGDEEEDSAADGERSASTEGGSKE